MARFFERKVIPFIGLVAASTTIPSPGSLGSNVTILLHNDLYGNASSRTNAAIVLGRPQLYQVASKSCDALGEKLWTATQANQTDFLEYLDYDHQPWHEWSNTFWIGGNKSQGSQCPAITARGQSQWFACDTTLPVLCSQSAQLSSNSTADTSLRLRTQVTSGDATFTGYRDKLSFRFLGIRYGTFPKRFTYSKVYENKGNVSALDLGPQCLHSLGTDPEDCLYLNIWTPFLPNPLITNLKNSSKASDTLKPVMFWIHGGGFVSGTGSDPNFDGGNLVSRGDVVVVTINYRLSTLGFLALADGKTNGNFGLADQITALDWLRTHVRDFGGDPDNITIFGQSAGAASVRALLGSPEAKGKFSAAIMMSNLGGRNYATTFSKYNTIAESKSTTDAILNATGCTGSDPLACLQNYDAGKLVTLGITANVLVVDGKYITEPELILNQTGHTANVPVMMGIMRDDGDPFISYPKNTSLSSALDAQHVNSSAIIQSGLFPEPQSQNATRNVFNVSSLVATDIQFRCIDHATAISATNHSVFDKLYFYQFNRAYQISWDPNAPTCDAPVTASHPNGDPSLEYFKCHSGELYYVFGVLTRMGVPIRDEIDIPFSQLTVDLWTSFARWTVPNPDQNYLNARGFFNTTLALSNAGQWFPVRADAPSLYQLQWPSKQVPFEEGQRCALLGLPYDYYETN